MTSIRKFGVLFGILIALLTLTSAASAASMSSFTTTTTMIQGGKTFYVSVRLASAAPAGGQLVTFSSSNSYASAPAAVTIAAGRTSASAKYTSRVVTRDIAVTLTAESLGVSRDLVVTFTPPALTSISTPSKLVLGASGSASVRLGAAPAADTVIALSSSDDEVASAPSTVTILAGKTSASFKVTAGAEEGVAMFTASLGSISKTDTTQVGYAVLSSVSTPSKLIAGKSGTGSVRISGYSLGSTVVELTSSDPAALTVPESVTILNGKTSVSFPVTSSSSGNGMVTVTATLRSVTKTDTTAVSPAQFSSLGVTRSMASYGSTTGKVRLTGPAPAGGITISLSATPGNALRFPASVTIPEGADYANVPIYSNGMTAETIVTMTAVAPDGVTKTALVTVRRPELATSPLLMVIAAAPQPVGSNSELVVGFGLSRKAPAAGVDVRLTSSNQAVIPLNETVRVTSGNDVFAMSVTTGQVTMDTSVRITATMPTGSLQITVTVKPFIVQTVTLSQSTVTAPAELTGTVWLTAPAPVGGATVRVNAHITNTHVPASVFIPEGQMSANFPITVDVTPNNVTVPITVSGFIHAGAALSVLATPATPTPQPTSTVTPTEIPMQTETPVIVPTATEVTTPEETATPIP